MAYLLITHRRSAPAFPYIAVAAAACMAGPGCTAAADRTAAIVCMAEPGCTAAIVCMAEPGCTAAIVCMAAIDRTVAVVHTVGTARRTVAGSTPAALP